MTMTTDDTRPLSAETMLTDAIWRLVPDSSPELAEALCAEVRATLDAERDRYAALDETCRSEGCQLLAQTLSYLSPLQDRHAVLVKALVFIADWAHDCISPEDTEGGYGFADIEKMARAVIDGEPR
jgi:hypothetical protein